MYRGILHGREASPGAGRCARWCLIDCVLEEGAGSVVTPSRATFWSTDSTSFRSGADFPMTRSHFALEQALAFRIEPTGGVGGHVADGRSGLLRLQLPWVIEQLGEYALTPGKP